MCIIYHFRQNKRTETPESFLEEKSNNQTELLLQFSERVISDGTSLEENDECKTLCTLQDFVLSMCCCYYSNQKLV